MYKHHSDSIKKITEKLLKREEVLAILLVGTIAQGFADEFSDIDLLIVVCDNEYTFRKKNSELMFYDKECADYEGGYIDGKYINLDYLKQVGIKGSEASRYAFIGAKILYSKIKDLQEYLDAAKKYPIDEKHERINDFCSQLAAWCWYANEAIKENNYYLLSYSVPNVILFGGRAILALNETLYPYHKWFMRILEQVSVKPDDLMDNINGLLTNPSIEKLDKFCDSIFAFVNIDKQKLKWTNHFVLNNEMNWRYPKTPIADI